jgi:hypothetical protein
MLPAKTKRFDDIKDEVQDFHPLLVKLLPHLPHVIDVEYTQGQNEMGADFVVSRRDETFGFTDYIGVVAKVGGIVQNFSEVERQWKRKNNYSGSVGDGYGLCDQGSATEDT